MANYDYNLVVIGGGPAGEKGACQAAYFGLEGSIIPDSCGNRAASEFRTALIEKEAHLGGSCINTGTLPSKTLRESALFLSGARSRQLSGGLETGVRDNITLFDFMHRAHQVQMRERERAELNLQRHAVTRIRGFASLVSAHEIAVTRADGTRSLITAEFVLIATGSSPARPDSIPFDGKHVFDSDAILHMDRMPRSLLVVGGGVIGCEYACLFAALGIPVVLVNRSAKVLEFLDHEIVDAFMDSCRGLGMELALNDDVEGCVVENGEVITRLRSGRVIRTDALLYAAGRGGNTRGLGLEALGIPVGRFGNIEQFNPTTYQTTVPNIYAAGDVVGRPALASTSMEQGRLAICDAFRISYRNQRLNPVLPAGVYTIPEISRVGESEESIAATNATLRAEGKPEIRYVVGRNRFGDHARGHIIGDTAGMIKLLFSVPEGALIGCHIIGENASELSHIGMACIQLDGGIDFLLNAVFNYPTLSDVYKYAAYDALGRLNKVRVKD